jgi:hypothetical protein
VIRQIERAIREMRAEVLQGVQQKEIRASLKVLMVIRDRTETMLDAAKSRKPALAANRKPK